MREPDFAEFGGMLDAVCGLLSRGTYVPNATNTALWFRALAAYDIATVRAGFDGHVKDPQRGRFVPTPADIVAQIVGAAAADGRPGPEEAWAIAVQATDEARTVVWTDEIAQAWGMAQPVLQKGDDVGARMTFREVYNRLVTDAREAGRKPMWTASLGDDKEQRDIAMQRAWRAGLLPKPEPVAALPAPDHALSPTNTSMPPHVREQLMAVRERLLAREPLAVPEEAPARHHKPIPASACPWNAERAEP